MKGMQEEGVMACAKHFPGHGDTDVDSHYDLPVLTHTRKRLDSLEMMPFRVLSQLGVQSVMTAHLSVPAIDDRINRPVSLSEKAITGILKNQFHFDGLIFTDALEMKGVAKNFKPGIMELEALKAGVVRFSMEDFYYLSRATLVKDERNLDKFDKVFGSYFEGYEYVDETMMPDIPDEWLKAMAEKFLTPEEMAEIASNIANALNS